MAKKTLRHPDLHAELAEGAAKRAASTFAAANIVPRYEACYLEDC